MRITLFALTTLRHAAAALLLVITTALFAAQDAGLRPIKYTSEGGIPLPDYSKWVFIGSGMFTSAQPSENPRFSNVFVEPEAYDQYMKTGIWPDRTIIVSDKRASVTTLPITTNNGWAPTGGAVAVELEVKDASKGGWVFYATSRAENVGKPVPNQTACQSCHAKHAAVDNTFVQFYPTLIDAAKRNGTFKETTK